MRTLSQAGGQVSALGEPQTLETYFRAYSSLPWADLPTWPPDIFCLCNLILDQTEAYRFVVAPPLGRPWPPASDWNDCVATAARQWANGEASDLVRRCWGVITASRQVPLPAIGNGTAWETCAALLTLHAVADQAAAELASVGTTPAAHSFLPRALAMLARHGSLSRLSPTRVRVVPKANFAARGITIRSISRYLALSYEAVDVRWRRLTVPASTVQRRGYNVVLLPWPLRVHASDFHPVHSPLGNMDTGVFGFFEFTPRERPDPDQIVELLRHAREQAGCVDGVILPEGALCPAEVDVVESICGDYDVTLLVAGVQQHRAGEAFGRNYLHIGVRTPSGWQRYQQDKHHRWCLDESQLRQYHLTHRLDPAKQWWEAIDIPPRALHIVDLGAGGIAAPLICEDLARTDEVNDLLRRVGPSLVVTVLFDGPQLCSRWPSRYATVLAAEAGSAVLTLTSYGMTARSCPAGFGRSRAVASWADATHGVREINLGYRAQGILMNARMHRTRRWTADGRCHVDVPRLTLEGTSDLRLRHTTLATMKSGQTDRVVRHEPTAARPLAQSAR